MFMNFDDEAAVAYGPGEPFVVERVLVHPPQKMEVRIKILFTSICHTDLSAWQGEVCIYIYIYIYIYILVLINVINIKNGRLNLLQN